MNFIFFFQISLLIPYYRLLLFFSIFFLCVVPNGFRFVLTRCKFKYPINGIIGQSADIPNDQTTDNKWIFRITTTSDLHHLFGMVVVIIIHCAVILVFGGWGCSIGIYINGLIIRLVCVELAHKSNPPPMLMVFYLRHRLRLFINTST